MEEHGLNERQLIGSRIREARVGRRMSQADLAAKANISLPHVSAIETGKTNMKLESFIRIIEALQVSADSLLRPDVPEVRSLYQSEFDELVSMSSRPVARGSGRMGSISTTFHPAKGGSGRMGMHI